MRTNISLDENKYINEFLSFSKKIEKNFPIIDDKMLLNKSVEICKPIEDGIKSSSEYSYQVKVSNNYNYDDMSRLLNKDLSELRAEEVILIDNLFREFFLEGKENEITKDKRFLKLIKKYLNFIEDFSINEDNAKEMFYKHNIVKDKKTKELIDKIFDKKNEFYEKENKIIEICDDNYFTDSEKIKLILEKININDINSNKNFKEEYNIFLINKAINYILFANKVENPLILKLYLTYNSSLFKTNFSEIIKQSLENELLVNFNLNKEKSVDNLKFSINLFLYNSLNYKLPEYFLFEKLAISRKRDILIKELLPKRAFFNNPEKFLSFNTYHITNKNGFNFLKQKILYEYSKEMGYPIEKLTTKKDEPLIAYFKFIDAFIEGKLEDADKAFKEVEKYTKDYMKMIGKNFELFLFFRNATCDKIGFYLYMDSLDYKDLFDKARNLTIKKANAFKTKIKKLVEKYKDSLFWSFLADTAFSYTFKTFNTKNAIKRHYDIMNEISNILSSCKLFNQDNNFIKKYYDYFISLSKIVKLSVISRDENLFNTSIAEKTDYKKNKNLELTKYMLYLAKSQLIPISYNDLFFLYEKNFSPSYIEPKIFSNTKNYSDKNYLLNFLLMTSLLLKDFKPFIKKITDENEIKKNKQKKEDFSKDSPEILSFFNYKILSKEANGREVAYALSIKTPVGSKELSEDNIKYLFSRSFEDFSFEKILIADEKKFNNIVLNKVKNNDYEFKTFSEFFISMLDDETAKIFKKEMVNFIKTSLSYVRDARVSEDSLIKTYLNIESFLKEGLFNNNYIPILIGPLEYKKTPKEALKEAAAVFAVNFKKEVDFVKSLISKEKSINGKTNEKKEKIWNNNILMK